MNNIEKFKQPFLESVKGRRGASFSGKGRKKNRFFCVESGRWQVCLCGSWAGRKCSTPWLWTQRQCNSLVHEQTVAQSYTAKLDPTGPCWAITYHNRTKVINSKCSHTDVCQNRIHEPRMLLREYIRSFITSNHKKYKVSNYRCLPLLVDCAITLSRWGKSCFGSN